MKKAVPVANARAPGGGRIAAVTRDHSPEGMDSAMWSPVRDSSRAQAVVAQSSTTASRHSPPSAGAAPRYPGPAHHAASLGHLAPFADRRQACLQSKKGERRRVAVTHRRRGDQD